MQKEVRVLDDAGALARAAAEVVVMAAASAVAARGRFTIALSGGSTPKRLYALLATDAALRARMPWAQTHFFWGDERQVAIDHPDSNYRMTREAMLLPAGVPADNVHRIRGELADANQAAREYESLLRAFFRLAPGERPRFDLVLLGLGTDAHTASLFPHTAALSEQTRLVVANPVPQLGATRITLTAPVFNHAACVVFLVSGADKVEALSGVLYGAREPSIKPAQLIAPSTGKLVWLVDRAAAGGKDSLPGA